MKLTEQKETADREDRCCPYRRLYRTASMVEIFKKPPTVSEEHNSPLNPADGFILRNRR
jgi:hypothetical protein